ncbi:DUF305 domain-containing protein [Actinocorallia sp. A-T 12471]|uniref:DUF305 domain-containing protein n=1 Tax=Actinocorallia sp. A-T 12471 TaxID=3089813 RepID=UPI0029CB91F9|nr:DUF305 domain-containing protein [Actinocorallia sp. A-T 12471]MDX6739425.1 DUF305 domain-containing protein [Actinocorallia sp. A-T 12471]
MTLPRPAARISRLMLGLVLLVAAGLVGAFLAAPDRPVEGSPEAGFSRDMAVHHTQAVEMALIIRDNTDDAELRTIALDMLLTQQNQIGRMQDWLIQWGLPLTGARRPMEWMGGHHGGGGTADYTKMPGMASQQDLARLREARGRDAEVLFLTLMIAHHQGGVDMAEAVLPLTDDAHVRSLARSIVRSQSAEITVLKQLLEDRGGSPAS